MRILVIISFIFPVFFASAEKRFPSETQSYSIDNFQTNYVGMEKNNCDGVVKINWESKKIWIIDAKRSRVKFKVCQDSVNNEETCRYATPINTMTGKQYEANGTSTGTRSIQHTLSIDMDLEDVRIEVILASRKGMNRCYSNLNFFLAE